eukprot:1875206-Lingulodinium_polyedra.AAC.1
MESHMLTGDSMHLTRESMTGLRPCTFCLETESLLELKLTHANSQRPALNAWRLKVSPFSNQVLETE